MRPGIVAMTVLTIAASAASADDPAPEDARLAAFFQAYLDESFAARPLDATRLGDHRFDHQLDDLSAEARAANRERDRRTLADLPKKVDYAKLSRSGQIDFEILRHTLERDVWLADNFDPYRDDPRTYSGYLGDSVYLLLTQSTRPQSENVAAALARIRQIPRLVDQAQAAIGDPPRVMVETAIRQAEGAARFYRGEIFDLTELPRDHADLAPLAAQAAESIDGFVAFLKETVLPRSNPEGWRIGREKFAKKLELELDAGLTADEVLAEAEAEAVRVERELYVTSRQLWGKYFPDRALPPDDPDGRREAVRLVLGAIADDHGEPAGLVSDVRSTVDEITKFITAAGILRLPEPDRCRIAEMPEFRRGNSVAYLDSSPPLDPAGSSEYAVSPPPADWDAPKVESYLREYNRPMLKILTIHEAYPGHYVQLEYSNRCPSLIRRVLSSGTFAEGWAVYTEQMMLDQGFGAGDPALRMQQLKFYLRAVVNAILDNKMHCDGMTDDQAMDLLVHRAFQTEGEALGKVIRSKQSSCQLSTYFVGRTAFYRLRQSLQREQGPRFSLGPYHEAVLSHGTLPVKYLPELVRQSLGSPPTSGR